MWEKLKTILKAINDKAIIVEDGEPKYVILSVDEYLRMSQLNTGNVEEQGLGLQNQPNTAQERLENLQEQQFVQNSANQNEIHAQPVTQDFTIDLSDIETDNDITQGNTPSDINLDDLPL